MKTGGGVGDNLQLPATFTVEPKDEVGVEAGLDGAEGEVARDLLLVPFGHVRPHLVVRATALQQVGQQETPLSNKVGQWQDYLQTNSCIFVAFYFTITQCIHSAP
jgi:hypothetical protein